MRIAIKHYDGSVQVENDAPNQVSETIIRQTKYGPMRFKRTGTIGGMPLFTIPRPSQSSDLVSVWDGRELLPERPSMPDTRWETFGAALFRDDDGAAA